MASFLPARRYLHTSSSCDEIKTFRIILLGDPGVGKTSLGIRLVKGTFRENSSGILGFETFCKEIEVDSRRYRLKIVDTAGQERFRCLTHNFYRGTDCCLLTFALDDFSSLVHLSDWQKEFLRFHHNSSIRTQSAFPFVVIGNKADLSNNRVVSNAQAREWCRAHGSIPYFEASAKTGQNTHEMFCTAVRRVRDSESMELDGARLPCTYSIRIENMGLNVEHGKRDKHSKCCTQ